jgi:SAM-dependent methyltransferase
MDKIFEHYYQHNFWGDAESVSGPGSNRQATAAIRQQLPALFTGLGIRNVLDAACGDFGWMKEIVRHSHLTYVGCDIVPELVAENNRRYGDDAIEFRVCDITRAGSIRRADLILARDVLVHLSHYGINRALKNFRASGSTWLLATTFPGAPIQDIGTGQWRPIDLTRLRFGLGPATLLLPETDADKLFGKSLGLWQLNGPQDRL